MFDRHEAQDGRNGHALPHRDAAGDTPLADRPMADREVPLPGISGGSTMAFHQWLDGDLSETEARRADVKQVEFWSRIAQETDRRHRMTTPAHLAGQIMAALPDRAVAMQTTMRTSAEPSRSAGISPMLVAMIGAGLFALGLAVGRLV